MTRQPLATPKEISEYLSVPLGTLKQWRWRGTGPKAQRVGGHIRYDWAEVRRWLEEQQKVGAA